MGRIVSSSQSGTECGAVPLIEESSQLLRSLPLSVLAAYAVGTLPFVLGLLFFWSDMSRSALAARHCSAGALGLGLLFIWMKCWQTVYCRQISAWLMHQEPPPWSFIGLVRMGARQSLVQATGFVLLPLAVLFTVPTAWVYAFYQNVTVLDDGGPEGLVALIRRAWHQAVLWPKQNHLILLIIGAFGIFVLLNSVLLLALGPMLLKRFLDLDTVFTLSGFWGLFNTTFLAVTVALAHVCIDPLIKTLYTLRCFYGRSLRTGEDLRARLARQRRVTAVLTLLALLAVSTVAMRAEAAAKQSPDAASTVLSAQIRPDDLDTTIGDVLAQPRYTWRLPREQATAMEETPLGWFASFFNWLEQALKTVMEPIARWLERFWEWLWERSTGRSEPEANPSLWPDLVKGLLILAGVLLVVFLVAAVRNQYQKKPRDGDRAPSMPVTTVPDLSDDHVRADALLVDEWRQLAEQLAAKGRFRLAMRACFFSTLGVLADHHLIMIADHKSNREYETEVVRRASDRPSLGSVFRWSVARLDRVWYGMRTVSRSDFHRFAGQQKEIADLVES
jgi:hypothetical protein